MSNKAPMTEQEQQAWVREQYQTATKFLASKGMITESVADTESRYLIPLMTMWKINLVDKTSVWVICGDLPTDFAQLPVAKDAREAVRHFSFKWQMQAENLMKTRDAEQEKFAQLLISRAEGLYDLFEKDELWEAQTA